MWSIEIKQGSLPCIRGILRGFPRPLGSTRIWWTKEMVSPKVHTCSSTFVGTSPVCEQQQDQGAKEPSHIATSTELYLSFFIMPLQDILLVMQPSSLSPSEFVQVLSI